MPCSCLCFDSQLYPHQNCLLSNKVDWALLALVTEYSIQPTSNNTLTTNVFHEIIYTMSVPVKILMNLCVTNIRSFAFIFYVRFMCVRSLDDYVLTVMCTHFIEGNKICVFFVSRLNRMRQCL